MEIELDQILYTDNNTIKTINFSNENNSDLTTICDSFDCQICHKNFTKLKYLKKHQKLHSGAKNYKCLQCERTYSRSDHLRRHQITHSEDTKPIRCDFCIQRFSNRCHMKRHIKIIHLEEIDKFEYKCEKCDLIFNKKHKLNKHNSIAHMENKKCVKKYECYYPFCLRTYHSKGKLDLHVEKVHVIENIENVDNNEMILDNELIVEKKKILQCPFEDCFKTYTTNYNLKVHIKTFHYGVEEFKCELENCLQTFKHKCSLERHQEKFHNINNDNIINVLA